MSKGDFELFALQMMTKVFIQVPRMEEVIHMMEVYEKNEVKWESIREYIE